MLITLEENENGTKRLACTKELNPDYSTSEFFSDFQKVNNTHALDL